MYQLTEKKYSSLKVFSGLFICLVSGLKLVNQHISFRHSLNHRLQLFSKTLITFWLYSPLQNLNQQQNQNQQQSLSQKLSKLKKPIDSCKMSTTILINYFISFVLYYFFKTNLILFTNSTFNLHQNSLLSIKQKSGEHNYRRLAFVFFDL